MKQIVIYPGRFQPMLSHHAKVYYNLQVLFPEADIYIGTSDKVEPGKSPFSFKEKQMIAEAQGISPDKVLLAPLPYVHTSYEQFDHENTVVFFAVGEKDSDRFPMNNVDKETGLDMTVRGEPRPKYYQMINTYNKDNPRPMSERGYIYNIENIVDSDNEVSSASAFREALLNSPSKEAAKEVFSKQFVDYREDVFELVYRKIVGEKMSEDLNILKQLAGLEVEESAPVEFEDNVEVKDIEFTKIEPGSNSSKNSIANRFPKDADVNDKKVKREEFIQALLKSPASLLSEINERIKPDENGLAASEKLTKIINVVEKEEGSIADLSEDDKKFTLDLVKKSINEMDLDAGDDSVYEPEGSDEPEESVDLSDIRTDYGIEELPEEEIQEGGDCYHCKGDDPDCDHCDGLGYVQFDDDPDEPSQEEIDANYKVVKKYIMKGKNKEESVDLSEISPDMDQKLTDIANRNKQDAEVTAQQRAIAQDLTGKQVGTVDAEIDRLKGSTNPAIKSLLQYKKALDILASQDSNIKQQVAGIIDKMNANPGPDSDSDYRADRGDNVYPEIDDSIDYDLQERSDGDDEPSIDINENMNAECQAEYKRLMTLDPQKANKFKATCMKLGPNATVDQAYSMMGESMYERSDGDDEPSISNMSDEDLMDYVGQKEEDLIDDMQQYLAPDHLHKDNFEEMFDKYREEVLEPAAHEISQDHAMDNMDEAGCTPAHRKANKKKKSEAIDDTSNKALEAAMDELKKLAGLFEEDKSKFDEAGCVKEMKKLYASGCAKESMYSKLNAEYKCNKKQFEELYAAHCV